MISGGRELSRDQLSLFRESLCSKVEDNGIHEAALEDEDGKIGGASRNPNNGAVKIEEISSSPGHIDDGLKEPSSLGSDRNHANAKRGSRGSIFGGRAKSSKAVDKNEGGIKVLHNPRVSLGECF
jgi:hypothetical protein